MANSGIEELLTEILVIKDLYICGRMNQSICLAVVTAGQEDQFTSGNWAEYEELSNSYVNDSIAELFFREDEIKETIKKFGPVSANLLFDTSYNDFDEELINEMMLDFYGDKDTVAFASSYNYFAEDFNALLSEFVINED